MERVYRESGADMMTKQKSKYKRCKKCKELVINPDNCANCANTNPLSLSYHRGWRDGNKGAPTLDIQEGNSEEAF
jgi:hypothetical protein